MSAILSEVESRGAKDCMATPVLSDSKQAGLRQGGRYVPRLMGQ